MNRTIPILYLALCLACCPLLMPAADESERPVPSGPDIGYRLYPGDLLRVQVYDHPDLTVDLRIPTDGRITFPLIGEVDEVVGLGTEAFNDILEKRLEDGFIREAVISLAVVEYGPRRAYVMGSVEQPNYVELNPFATLTAIQAIG